MAATKRTTTRTRASTKKDLDELRTRRASAEPEDEKTKTVKRARKAKVEKDVAEYTLEKVASALTKAELDVSKGFSAIRELFGGEIEGLSTIREAYELKQNELEELYGKYDYDLAQARRKDQDDWNEKVRQRVREQQEKEEQLVKDWTAREETVAKREQRMTELEAIEASFDQRVEEAAKAFSVQAGEAAMEAVQKTLEKTGQTKR